IPDTKVFLAERNSSIDIAKDFENQYGNELIFNFNLTDSQKIKVIK
uniref:SAM-dependent methyltransferase n=1 Tax=Meloidogyne hapla TaxID=6305 RepID=A0A1I8BI99_MELHA